MNNSFGLVPNETPDVHAVSNDILQVRSLRIRCEPVIHASLFWSLMHHTGHPISGPVTSQHLPADA